MARFTYLFLWLTTAAFLILASSAFGQLKPKHGTQADFPPGAKIEWHGMVCGTSFGCETITVSVPKTYADLNECLAETSKFFNWFLTAPNVPKTKMIAAAACGYMDENGKAVVVTLDRVDRDETPTQDVEENGKSED